MSKKIDEWSGLPVQPAIQRDSLPAGKEGKRIIKSLYDIGVIQHPAKKQPKAKTKKK